MWGRIGVAIALVTITLAPSSVRAEVGLSCRSREYSPTEFRTLLRGFGYDVNFDDIVTDEPGKKAIREFQEGYKLKIVNGQLNESTQELAAALMINLQGSLNIFFKLNPPLPRNQFYGPRTEAAIQKFQKQFNLPETGIATLPLRQKLDIEVKKILGIDNPIPYPCLSGQR